jgi:hypothetical protein
VRVMFVLADSIDLGIWLDATKGIKKAKAARLAIESILKTLEN